MTGVDVDQALGGVDTRRKGSPSNSTFRSLPNQEFARDASVRARRAFPVLLGGELLPLKLWYFFYIGGQYAQSFLPLIFLDVMHFAPFQIGVLLFLRRFCISLFAAPFGNLCDRTGLHRVLVVFGLAFHYALTLLLVVVDTFPLAMAVMIVREIAVAGVDSVVNSAAIAKLEDISPGGESAYGKLRGWGSFGWGVSSLVCCVVVDSFFKGNVVVILFSQALIGIVVMVVAASLVDLSRGLFDRHAERRQRKIAELEAAAGVSGGNASKDMGVMTFVKLILSREVWPFAANVVMYGIVQGAMQTTLYIYAASLGVSTTLLGVTVCLSSVLQAIMFHYTDRFLAVLGGIYHLHYVSILCSVASLVAFAAIPLFPNIPFAYLLVDTISGATYSLYWSAGVALASALAPPRLSATAQGTLTAASRGLGAAIGALSSGLMLQVLGAQMSYILLALAQLFVVVAPVTNNVLRLTAEERKHIAKHWCPLKPTTKKANDLDEISYVAI